MINTSQIALINEYKGYLFEYLVGLNIATTAKIESEYINSINPVFIETLQKQEEYIRSTQPKLISILASLANDTAAKCVTSLNLSECKKIYLVGKFSATLSEEKFAEADLVLLMKDDVKLPISLKLSKMNSYVNTKSGGVKSFISKYFHFNNAIELQNELIGYLNDNYTIFQYQIHEIAGIEYTDKFENWIYAGLSELPGGLDKELAKPLHELYYKINQKIYKILKSFFEEDPIQFKNDIATLFGFSNSDIIQIICYYDLKKNLLNSDIIINRHDDSLQGLVEFSELNQNIANFNIKLDDKKLQIRIKPMNKFTTGSFKINCSVKYR